MTPGVLMLTGAYYPEVSGAGLQCRQLVLALRQQVAFIVLTTTGDPVSSVNEVDGVPVARVAAPPTPGLGVALGLMRAFFRYRHRFQLVHLHGFSRKSVLVIMLARLFRKRTVLKLTSVGHDDPAAIRARGRVAYGCYRRVDLLIGVSPRQAELCRAAGLPAEKFQLIPNGVDLERFRPAARSERRRLRAALGLPENGPLVLFVGFFSREKCPDVLFEAWRRIATTDGDASSLVFVGATRLRYYEIDPALAQGIARETERLGLGKRVTFVELTHEIEQYYRAADVFVLPSTREGLPNALLEAMATGLAAVTSRLPGVTDWVIDSGVNGLLVTPGDPAALEAGLRQLFAAPDYAEALGAKARATIVERFGMAATASRCLEVYEEVLRSHR